MNSAAFTTPIRAFHLTNPIARASRTMAECAELVAGVSPAVAAE
jgi:NADH-quinone oxidoreductase subunit G